MEKIQMQTLLTNKVNMAARLHAITSAAFGLLPHISANLGQIW